MQQTRDSRPVAGAEELHYLARRKGILHRVESFLFEELSHTVMKSFAHRCVVSPFDGRGHEGRGRHMLADDLEHLTDMPFGRLIAHDDAAP